MVSKRARRNCTIETISCFVRSGPPWSIFFGLHEDNVGHDAPVWSQIPPSPILLKEAAATSMMHLKVTGKGTLPVWSQILPSPILFKEVTATENLCLLDDFLVTKSFINRRITDLQGWKTFTPVGRMESECSTAFQSRGTPLFLRGEEIDLLFLATIEKAR